MKLKHLTYYIKQNVVNKLHSFRKLQNHDMTNNGDHQRVKTTAEMPTSKCQFEKLHHLFVLWR